MTFGGFSRPFGTCGMATVNPAVNCRAILNSPSGREIPAPASRRRRSAKAVSRCALASGEVRSAECLIQRSEFRGLRLPLRGQRGDVFLDTGQLAVDRNGLEGFLVRLG